MTNVDFEKGYRMETCVEAFGRLSLVFFYIRSSHRPLRGVESGLRECHQLAWEAITRAEEAAYRCNV